jgi:hypothetical protein
MLNFYGVAVKVQIFKEAEFFRSDTPANARAAVVIFCAGG